MNSQARLLLPLIFSELVCDTRYPVEGETCKMMGMRLCASKNFILEVGDL